MKKPSILLALLFCLSCDAKTVLRNGTFRTLNSRGAPPPGDGYEANLYAYYTFDDVAGGAIDSLGAWNLNLDSGNQAAALTTGIIGGAFNFGANGFDSIGLRYPS